MPALLLISASGTAQRRLLEETSDKLAKEGYGAAGRQEGGEWNALLSDNMTGGLFDDKRFIVVDGAASLGAFPEKLSRLVDANSSVAIILVYESASSAQPSKFIPKDVMSKCKVIKAPEFPRWPNQRQVWVAALAKELGVNISRAGIAMITELLEDPEEIRAQMKSLALLKKGSQADAKDVEELCLDDGGRNLLRLLDGLCSGDCLAVLKSLRAASRSSNIIETLAPVHNRMRLAWYAGLGKDAAAFARALGAKDYAWRMATAADKRYGHTRLTDFMAALIRLNVEERNGIGSGYPGLESEIIKLIGGSRRQ